MLLHSKLDFRDIQGAHSEAALSLRSGAVLTARAFASSGARPFAFRRGRAVIGFRALHSGTPMLIQSARRRAIVGASIRIYARVLPGRNRALYVAARVGAYPDHRGGARHARFAPDTSILRTGLSTCYRLAVLAPAKRAGAQRLCALGRLIRSYYPAIVHHLGGKPPYPGKRHCLGTGWKRAYRRRIQEDQGGSPFLCRIVDSRVGD
jgi:hypothetical protein